MSSSSHPREEDSCPATDIDPIHRDDDYAQLLGRALDIRSGRHYFNPRPLAD